MRRLKAGSLRHRVTLQALQSEQDDSDGQVEETYLPIGDVWADVRMVSGKEYVQGDARQSGIVATIRIRYRPGLEASMRVIHNGRTFHVEAVLDDPESGRDWATLACSEVRPG